MGAIDAYVRQLDLTLQGPSRARRDLVREAHDHLLDAAEALGDDREAAERAAVRQFGTIGTVAPGFQAVLSATRLRHVSLALLLATIGQPLAWDLKQDDGTGAQPLVVLQEVVQYVGLITIAIAALTAVTLGVGLRLGSITPRRMRLAAMVSSTSSVSVAVIGSAMLLTGASGWRELGYGAAVTVVPMLTLAFWSFRAIRPLATSSTLERVQL